MKILNEAQRDKFKRLYDFIKSFLDNKNSTTNSKNIYLLKKLKELSSKESPDKVLKKLQSEIRDGLITVPQDAFFICKIQNLKPIKSESLGYFAMLRYIQPLAISSNQWC